jgi:hypothetical protein
MRHGSRLMVALALSAALSPAARAAGGASAVEPEWVHLRGEKVVRLQVARAGRDPAQRAEEANHAIGLALEREAAEAWLHPEGESVVVQVGMLPILALDAADARAGGAASLEAHATTVAARLDAVLRAERRRALLAGTVFQVSLLVFAGLIAWLLLRRLSALERQLRPSLSRRPGARPLTVAGIDVSHAAAPPGTRAALLFLARLLAQLLVVWIWLLFGLSLFPGSRPAADWLLRTAFHPVVELAQGLGAALPGLIGAGVLALLAVAAVRTLRFLFEQAARGEATLPLVSRERAMALGRISSALVVLLAVLLAAPLVAGGDGNALGRLGEAALLTVALALVPLAASALAGLPVLLGRDLQPGDRVELAGRSGRVVAFGALGLELEEPGGGRATVPWLLTLFHPLRRLPPGPGDGAAPP